MAKSQRAIVTLNTSTVEVGPRFTDVEQVMTYLNATLSDDLRRIQELATNLEAFYQDGDASQRERTAAWQRFFQTSADDTSAMHDKGSQTIAAVEQQLAAMAAALIRLDQALKVADIKSQAIDGAIAQARSDVESAVAHVEAATDDLVAMRDLVLESHESKWVETQQQLQHDRSDLSQQLSSQISTHVGEIEGINHAWRTQIEATSETWRKQIEAANQGWQMGQAQQAEQWRDETSRDMAQRTDTSLRAAHTATERADQLADQIALLSQRLQETHQEVQSQLATDRSAWEAANRAQQRETDSLRRSVRMLHNLIYGAGAIVAILTVLCIIALVR